MRRKRSKFVIYITIILAFLIMMPTASIKAVDKEYKEVEVPALWIPIDPTTHEVLEDLTPHPTNPSMFERSEVAELVNGEYLITYMGTPKPLSPGSWSANNFMYYGNVMYRNKYHRVVANGMSNSHPLFTGTSSVLKVEYGDFVDENYSVGLNGMTQTVYQPDETLKLYLKTVSSNLSKVTFEEEQLDIYLNLFSEAEILEQLYNNFVKVDSYLELNPASFASLDQSNVRERLTTVWIYDEVNETFIMENGAYKDFKNGGLKDLAPGNYTVVFPFYYEIPIPEWLSSPDVFSRNRYTLSDSVYFSLTTDLAKGTLEIHYKDTSDKTIAASDTFTDLVGSIYSLSPKKIHGYTLVDTIGEAFGKYTVEPIEITFVYAEEEDVKITYKATEGGTVDPEVEIVAPASGVVTGSTATPSAGYQFVNWTNEQGVEVGNELHFVPAKNEHRLNVSATYTANFIPNQDTKYKVNHHLQELGKETYALYETETLGGTTNELTAAKQKEFAGFTVKEFTQKTIAGDGSTVVDIYYTRNTYEVLYQITGLIDANEKYATQRYEYGQKIRVLDALSKPGYTFVGWLDVLETMPSKDIVVTGSFTENESVTITYKTTEGGMVDPELEIVAPVTGITKGSTAKANTDYEFVQWTDEKGNVVSKDAHFVPAKDADGLNVSATYTAHFEEVDHGVLPETGHDNYIVWSLGVILVGILFIFVSKYSKRFNK